jgi:hypothetical protein
MMALLALTLLFARMPMRWRPGTATSS